MKFLNIIHRVAALAVTALMAGCAKESDSLAPTNPTTAPIHQFAVGDTWPQGPAATGLCATIMMTKVFDNSTGNGSEIAKWTGHTDCPTPVKTYYKATYTNEFGQTFEYNTTTQTTGDVSMLTFYHASHQ